MQFKSLPLPEIKIYIHLIFKLQYSLSINTNLTRLTATAQPIRPVRPVPVEPEALAVPNNEALALVDPDPHLDARPELIAPPVDLVHEEDRKVPRALEVLEDCKVRVALFFDLVPVVLVNEDRAYPVVDLDDVGHERRVVVPEVR